MSRYRCAWLGVVLALAYAGPTRAAEKPFFIFFDWGQAVVTPAAGKLVSLIKTRIGKGSHVEILGHTDTSEPDKVAGERALAVRNKLIGAGVSRGMISVGEEGSRNPLVPTDANVREPQNRFVSVTIQ